MKYSFIDDHREQWPVSVQCRMLHVSRSGVYVWCSREKSITAVYRAELTERIRDVHQSSRRTNGSPRIHAEMIAQGDSCNRKTVAKCMRNAGIQAKSHRMFRVRTTDSNRAHPVARNIVNWLGRSRRLSKDYERTTSSSEVMIQLCCIHQMLKRLEPKGTQPPLKYRLAS